MFLQIIKKSCFINISVKCVTLYCQYSWRYANV